MIRIRNFYIYYSLLFSLLVLDIVCQKYYAPDKQISKIIKEVGIKNLPMKEKIRSEVDRIKKFYSMILNEEAQVYLKDVHSIAHETFILQEGSIEEQRDIMNCLKGLLVLQDRKIALV